MEMKGKKIKVERTRKELFITICTQKSMENNNQQKQNQWCEERKKNENSDDIGGNKV